MFVLDLIESWIDCIDFSYLFFEPPHLRNSNSDLRVTTISDLKKILQEIIQLIKKKQSDIVR